MSVRRDEGFKWMISMLYRNKEKSELALTPLPLENSQRELQWHRALISQNYRMVKLLVKQLHC